MSASEVCQRFGPAGEYWLGRWYIGTLSVVDRQQAVVRDLSIQE